MSEKKSVVQEIAGLLFELWQLEVAGDNGGGKVTTCCEILDRVADLEKRVKVKKV